MSEVRDCYGSDFFDGRTNFSGKIRTAEGITKFLRSKETSIDDIVKVSNELLGEDLVVYLPNKVAFVFELLCDRLNDNKTKKFREISEIWALFNKSWLLLDSQPKIRTRIFQGLKLGEALAFALSNSESTITFLKTISSTINLVRLNSIINNTFDFSIEILTQYLILVNELSTDLKDAEVNQLVDDIVSFFQTEINAEKLTKKFISNFASTALPSILKLADTRQQDFKPLTSLIRKLLLTKEQQENLIPNLELLLKSQPSRGAIVLYYKIVIDTISKSDVESAEKMFTIITTKYPESSEKLLEYLSNIKRTLSQEFLNTVIENEFTKKSQNWNLILSVIELDIEVGIKNAERIMTNLETQTYDGLLKIGEQLVECFIRARELVNFFDLWYNVLLNPNSKWKEDEFREIVSSNIHVLSFSQLKTLIEMLLSKGVNTQQLILLNTVTQGLFRTQDMLAVQQSKELFGPVWTFEQDLDELWTLKYQLLCLYEDILDDDGLEKVIFSAKGAKSIQHFYTLFRIREMHEFDITPLALSLIKSLKKRGSLSHFKIIFTRWFVIINEFFGKEQIEDLVNALLEDEQLALSIFENDLLFEQQVITEALITRASAFLDKKSEKSAIVEILTKIPIQCYPRRLKSIVLDQLVGQLLNKSSNNDKLLDAIVHILQTPTFKSKIESDISTIVQIIDQFPETKVFEKVWLHHSSQVKEQVSQNYIHSILKEITREFSKSKNTKLSSSFYIAFTILSNPPSIETEKVTKLQAVFVKSSKSLLNSFIGSKKAQSKVFEISWLLNVLYKLDLSVEDFATLKPSIQSFGKQLDERSFEAKANIFLLFSKYSKTGEFSAEYFEALYIVLRESGAELESLIEGLGNVIAQLTEDEFNQSLGLLLESFNEQANALFLTEILSVYWKYFQRESSSSINFFTKSLSTILINFSKISNSSALIITINSIKTILTEKSWIVTQYGLELIITLLSTSADSLLLENNEVSEQIYQSITLVLSNILLFQRYRLSNRHHIILQLFKSLLACLTRRKTNTILSHSLTSAEAFSRVLSNLCEPPQHNFKDNKDTSLNSSSSIVKRSLRKHLPVLLLSYIYFALKFSFDSKIREALLPGVFNIFDVLSQSELVLVSTSLDYSGRTYYRSLYDDYKKTGKWKTD